MSIESLDPIQLAKKMQQFKLHRLCTPHQLGLPCRSPLMGLRYLQKLNLATLMLPNEPNQRPFGCKQHKSQVIIKVTLNE